MLRVAQISRLASGSLGRIVMSDGLSGELLMFRRSFRSFRITTSGKPEDSQRYLISERVYLPVFQSVESISSTSLLYAKKRKRPQKGKDRPEVVDVDEEDDDDPDDVVDEKMALAAKGILHKGVGEAEEIVDDGLPKDYKRRVLKLGSRRLDTLLNRTSGRSSA